MDDPTQGARSARLAWSTLGIGAVLLGGGILLDASLGGPRTSPVAVGLVVAALALAPLWLVPPAWHRRLLLALVAVVVALALTEGALRLFTPWGGGPAYELHERYLHRYVPGLDRVYYRSPANGGTRVAFAINERGFRGPLPDQEKTRTRVVVYGDSFVAGQTTPIDQTLVARLGVHLTDRLGRPVEMVNAGVNGYGPDQCLLRMEDELGSLAPELVVLVVFAGNDFGDLVRNKLIGIGADGRLEELPHEIAESLREQFEGVRSVLAIEQLVRAGPAAGEPIQPVETPEDVDRERARMANWHEIRTAEYIDAVVRRDPWVRDLLGDSYDADVALTPSASSARYKLELIQLVFARIHAVCREHGAALGIVVMPAPGDATTTHERGRVDTNRFRAYTRAGLSRAAQAAAARAGVPALDLFDTFEQHGANDLYMLHGDGHLNERGEDLAARATTEFVLSHGLLK